MLVVVNNSKTGLLINGAVVCNTVPEHIKYILQQIII